MKNKIEDLNNHLFQALERLNDEDLTADQIRAEASRARAIVDISEQIIDTRRVTVDAARLVFNATGKLPKGGNGGKLIGHDPDA